MKEYANNFTGIVLRAYDEWLYSRGLYGNATDDYDRMIYTGQCQAYALIIRQATGREPHFFKSSDQLESFVNL